jgi:ribonuclease P protein component
MSFEFPSEQRLKSRKTITHLFTKGSGFMAYPFRVMWCRQDESAKSSLQMAVSVPKRNFKHAVDRNLLKRRSREAWRLHKADLPTHPDKKNIAFMLIYVAKEKLSYQDIERGIEKTIKLLPQNWS